MTTVTATVTVAIALVIAIAIAFAESAQTTHLCQIHETALILWQQIACKPMATQRHGNLSV